jgi:hypothetical protein
MANMELPLELGMPPLHVSCPQRPGRPTTQTKEASTTYLMDTVVFLQVLNATISH